MQSAPTSQPQRSDPGESPPQSRAAWQPFTPRGAAAFARAPLGRLLLVQFIVAAFAAGALVWFLQARWFPVISAAIVHLPASGEIRSGRLHWNGDSPVLLAEGRWLALTIDLRHQGQARSPAHLEVELGQSDWQLRSLFGYLSLSYRPEWSLVISRAELEPWWGAWAPELLAVAALGTVAVLLLIWALLATLYLLPVFLAGFFADRQVTVGGSWRLAGAALMPGALLMILATVAYGLGALDVVRLLAAALLHVVFGWVWVAFGIYFLPRLATDPPPSTNPFAGRH